MDVASGLFDPFSDETHELGDDTDADRVGDDSLLLLTLGGDRREKGWKKEQRSVNNRVVDVVVGMEGGLKGDLYKGNEGE
ncbi:hypothetical protein TSUD_340110 [Trifolium subterraneum]|uniref:Uncharacterized protein n=1 Tax=Trifolium subterraneum TaxID=3900 RepID=A0A2Z6MH84_TRISU|nr:hypothetical protein TSUD_340110 [Trifolium subterraneum]